MQPVVNTANTNTVGQTASITTVPENATAWERLNAYHGVGITIYGILFVFVGIVIIQISMNLFNYYFLGKAAKKSAEKGKGSFDYVEKMPIPDVKDEAIVQEDIPEDELIAIAAAIEVYRRLHFDRLPSKITFTRGVDAQNSWQMGSGFGHRRNN